MKYNYPVKYALMPIYEYISKDEKIVSYYIVSKCFLASEKKSYLRDGTFKIEYEVVFPYQMNNYINNYEYFRCYPKFNIYNECINSLIVRRIFEDKESAIMACNELNQKLLDEQYAGVRLNGNFQEEFEKIYNEYKRNAANYKKIEDLIEEELKILEVDNFNNNKNIIIVRENGIFKIYDCSIYDYLDWVGISRYDVYSVSYDDMDILEKEIESENNIDLNSIKLSKLLQVGNKNIYLVGENQKENIYLIENDTLVNINNQNAFSDSSEKIVLTTETYEEFIKSYSLKDKIDTHKKYVMKGLY